MQPAMPCSPHLPRACRASISGSRQRRRLGGDEFALISAPLEQPMRPPPLLRAVETVLMQPVLLRRAHYIRSASASAPSYSRTAPTSTSTRCSPTPTWRLYRAKRDGRGCSRVYDASLDDGRDAGASPLRDPGATARCGYARRKRRTARPRRRADQPIVIGAFCSANDPRPGDRVLARSLGSRYLLMREIFEPSRVRLYMRPF